MYIRQRFCISWQSGSVAPMACHASRRDSRVCFSAMCRAAGSFFFELHFGNVMCVRYFESKPIDVSFVYLLLIPQNTNKAQSCTVHSALHHTVHSALLQCFQCVHSFNKFNSLLVCPATEVFSSARRIKYGITSRTGPNGKYLATLYPFSAKL